MGCRDVKNNIFMSVGRYIRLRGGNLQQIINNRKIKSKTTYLYIFCVMVPVLITNVFVLGNTIKAAREESRENIANIVDSVAHNISSSFEQGVYATVDLYVSNSIYKFLDTQYKNNSEYLREYKSVFDNYVFYASSKHLISNMTFYSNNSTMINGGRYYRIDAIQDKEWYKEFVKEDKDLLIYPYYDNKDYVNSDHRNISVIRKLNNIKMGNIERIVKLDLNYSKIFEEIKNSAFNTIVYVCHNDKILFSNDEAGLSIRNDFENVLSISKKNVQLHKSLVSYGFEFDIYLMGYKSSYVSVLGDKLWFIAVLFMANALIPAFMLTLFSNSITKRVILLGQFIKKVKGEEFDFIPESESRDEIGELLGNYNLMVARMKNLIEYEYKSKLERQELHLARQQAELLALHSQINPHFMYNVLESVRMHCVIKGEEESSYMIESLARLMRKSAEWGSDLITIEQEIGFMRDYLNLQKYRYGDDFNYKLHISKDCNSYMIPSLVLVTFVENACVHGLNREGHSGIIFVTIKEDKPYLLIEIEDTGIGMEQEQIDNMEQLLTKANMEDLLKAESLGMLNANIRLKKYCGSDTKIMIESEKQVGTCIIIKIPLENLTKNNLH